MATAVTKAFVAGVYKFYSPSQPRNKDGEWSSGAGAAKGTGDGGSQPTPAKKENSLSILRQQKAPQLSAAQVESIKAYVGADSALINRTLRKAPQPVPTGVLKKAAEHHIEQINAAIAKSTIPENVTVYRGVGAAAAQQMGWPKAFQVGRTFSDKGFVSTTASSQRAGVFATGIKLRIEVPKGSKGLYLESVSGFKGEQELLLPSGSKFKITKVKGYDVTVQVVP